MLRSGTAKVKAMQTAIRKASFYSCSKPHLIPCIRRRLTHIAAVSSKDSPYLCNRWDEFMLWLRKKTGVEISNVLCIGRSSYGRSLFASKHIEDGDCILKIPYNAHLTHDKVLPEVESLIVDEVGTISRLAIVFLVEQGLGADSEWFPYINYLPSIDDMDNTIFWTPEELKMTQPSSIYDDSVNLKFFLTKEFSALKPVFKHFPMIFGDIRLESFMHAYALVISRAWRTSMGVSLVPFADFLNHDGASEAVLLSDDDKEISEVIADRNYAVGGEVVIRYGKFPNSTLMLDYGFTIPHNIYDQVEIFMDVPLNDPLYKMKMELLYRHSKQPTAKVGCFSSSSCSFIIKEVKTSCSKGRGIPQALRAFARIRTVLTCEELTSLATEACQIDGRLARLPLKSMDKEIQAHNLLILEFEHMINCRNARVKDLEASNDSFCGSRHGRRRRMAVDLLSSEIRVLRSASAWLKNYCQALSAGLELAL